MQIEILDYLYSSCTPHYPIIKHHAFIGMQQPISRFFFRYYPNSHLAVTYGKAFGYLLLTPLRIRQIFNCCQFRGSRGFQCPGVVFYLSTRAKWLWLCCNAICTLQEDYWNHYQEMMINWILTWIWPCEAHRWTPWPTTLSVHRYIQLKVLQRNQLVAIALFHLVLVHTMRILLILVHVQIATHIQDPIR